MKNDMFAGKVAVISGGAKNMGAAFVKAFADGGADVAIHYHTASDRERAESVASDARGSGARATLFEGDLTKPAIVKTFFDHVESELGNVDILVNGAGVVVKKPMVEITEAEYDNAFNTNAKAAFFCMQEAAKRMRDDGRIINLGTTLLGATTSYYGLYAGSKGALEHFTRALAKEVGNRGITVNTVAPGPIDTSFFFPVETTDSIAFLKSMSVQNRLGKIDEIVPLVAFLASRDAGWITAQTIFINGGFLAR